MIVNILCHSSFAYQYIDFHIMIMVSFAIWYFLTRTRYLPSLISLPPHARSIVLLHDLFRLDKG